MIVIEYLYFLYNINKNYQLIADDSNNGNIIYTIILIDTTVVLIL